jgi:hypothetical protein
MLQEIVMSNGLLHQDPMVKAGDLSIFQITQLLIVNPQHSLQKLALLAD